MKTLLTLIFAMAASQAMALEPAFSVQSIDATGVTITVKANLPDDMTLLCTLKSADGSYSGQGKFSVKSGVFSAGPYSNRGSALPTGSYTLNIKSGLPSLQPSSVQSIIGKLGENLSGTNTKTFIDSTVIEANLPVTIGSQGQTATTQQTQTMNELKKKYDEAPAKNAEVYKALDPLQIKTRINQNQDAQKLETFLKGNGFTSPTITEGLKLVGQSHTLWECEVIENGEKDYFVVLTAKNDFSEGGVVFRKEKSPW